MSIEEIRAALETANRGLPEAALRAAVTQPDALAPIVGALLKRAVEGEALLLAEENLIFFGVHAMGRRAPPVALLSWRCCAGRRSY